MASCGQNFLSCTVKALVGREVSLTVIFRIVLVLCSLFISVFLPVSVL